MSGFTGSMATDSTFLISAWFSGEIRCQFSPPSRLRKTPSRAPATKIFGSDAAMAAARMDLPCISGNRSHVFPPSLLRNTSPVVEDSTLQAETYRVLVLVASTIMWSNTISYEFPRWARRDQVAPPSTERYRVPELVPKNIRLGLFGS